MAFNLFLLHDDVIHGNRRALAQLPQVLWCTVHCFHRLAFFYSRLTSSSSSPLVLHLRTSEVGLSWTWLPYPACPPTLTSPGTPLHAARTHTGLAADLLPPLVSSTHPWAGPVPPNRSPSVEGSSKDSSPLDSAREIGNCPNRRNR